MIEQAIPHQKITQKEQIPQLSFEKLNDEVGQPHQNSLKNEIPKKVINGSIYKLPIEKVSALSNQNEIRRSLTLDSNYICFINQPNSITIKSIEYAFLNSTIEIEALPTRILDICLFENTNFSVLGIICDNGVISGYRIELSGSKATIYTHKILNYRLEGHIAKPQIMWKDSNKLGVAVKNELTLIGVNSEIADFNINEEVDIYKPLSFKVLQFEKAIKDFGFSPKYSLAYLLFENNLVQTINTENAVKIREFLPHTEKHNVLKLLTYKNLAKQDSVNMSGQKIEINKDRDYSLKDIFLTITEQCEIKVWDLSEWDKEKKSYYCIETFSLQKTFFEDEVSLKFTFFDPIKSSLFVVCARNESLNSCVMVLRINKFFQNHQESYKEGKKKVGFFELLEKVEFKEADLLGMAALNSTKPNSENNSPMANNSRQGKLNLAVTIPKTQAKSNFLIRNDIFTSFLSVFNPQSPKSLVYRERNSHLNAIIDGSNESPRSKLLGMNRDPMKLAWEPRNLSTILSGVKLESSLFDISEVKRKQSYEESKKQEINRSFEGTNLVQTQSSPLIEENAKKEDIPKAKKHRNRRKKNRSLVEPFIPEDKELEDFQKFVQRESQALMEQLEKQNLGAKNQDVNEVHENEIKLDLERRNSNKEQTSFISNQFVTSLHFEEAPQPEKLENEKIQPENNNPQASMELIESLIKTKISEYNENYFEEKITKEVNERVKREVDFVLEQKLEAQLGSFSQMILEKLESSFETERKFYVERLNSLQDFSYKIKEEQSNYMKQTNIFSQAFLQSCEIMKKLEEKLQTKISEFDGFIAKSLTIFQENKDLYKKIESIENIVKDLSNRERKNHQEATSLTQSMTKENLINQKIITSSTNISQASEEKTELSHAEKVKRRKKRQKQIRKDDETSPSVLQNVESEKLEKSVELSESINETHENQEKNNLNPLLFQNQIPTNFMQNQLPFPIILPGGPVQMRRAFQSWGGVLPGAMIPTFVSEIESQKEGNPLANSFPGPFLHFDQVYPITNVIQQQGNPPTPTALNLPPGLSLPNDSFSPQSNEYLEIKQNIPHPRSKQPSRSRLSGKYLESFEQQDVLYENELARLESEEEEEEKEKGKKLEPYISKEPPESYRDLLPKDLLQD